MDDLVLLEEFIREALLDEAKRGRKKKKKGTKKSTAKRRATKKVKQRLQEEKLQLADYQQRLKRH